MKKSSAFIFIQTLLPSIRCNSFSVQVYYTLFLVLCVNLLEAAEYPVSHLVLSDSVQKLYVPNYAIDVTSDGVQPPITVHSYCK